MRESRLDRCVMVFVLCLGIFIVLLQMASSPSGQDLPASIVALSIVVGIVAVTVGTLRSRAAGWNKGVVKFVGGLFGVMAVWLLCDPPRDVRTALFDAAIAVVLLGFGFRKKPRARWTGSDASTPSG